MVMKINFSFQNNYYVDKLYVYTYICMYENRRRNKTKKI